MCSPLRVVSPMGPRSPLSINPSTFPPESGDPDYVDRDLSLVSRTRKVSLFSFEASFVSTGMTICL